MKQYVVFKLEGEEFGIEISDVQGIERPDKIIRVPESPKYIEGIMDLRGNVIPVFNLRSRFQFSNKNMDENTKLVVVRVRNMQIAFIVDEVTEIIHIEDGDIQETPPLITNMDRRYIAGVGKYNDRLIILLDLDLSISEEETERIADLIASETESGAV